MGIFSRTRDIVAANVTDLLDGSKDPEKMIRMIILEMEETLVEVRASAARTIADQKEMRSSITRLQQLRDGWTEKAELALSRDREDLARQALIEKQKASDMVDSLSQEIAVLDATLRSYEDDIAKLQTKLRGARARQSNVQVRLEGAHNSIKLREMTNGERVHDAFARFETLERDVDYAEGRAEAAGMGSQPRTLEQEIEDLESNDRVDAELAAMKNAQGKKPASASKEA